ncbi:hypothetical protein [Kitasatospora phosalacinea]|uniref:Uncharacterized protein n=1 Tax=Kitasatospora phosalacinea TaxID=2065 RepID=A0A9W6UPL6_9ACTN|nr:hypothetical protein [Kitasatospora phosalacinea]GLW54690.1 hypothetical protein Kpho01_27010 [Kitasatospora phosalacinea]
MTTARLVELACGAIIELVREMPSALTDPGVPGAAGPEFRRLARGGQGATTDGVYRACELMTTPERRGAANTTLDTLVGYRVTRP